MYTLTTDDHSLQMTVVSLSYDGSIWHFDDWWSQFVYDGSLP